VQGFGKVGSQFSAFAAERGAKVVGISDSSGGVHADGGIDVAAALAHKRDGGSLADFPGGEQITNDELIALPCDVFAPCALEQVVTEANADSVKAGIVVEGANGPLTPGADDILEERGALILPDVLANAGGVVVSYFEWVQGLQEYFWKEDEVNAQLNEIITRAFEETWATRSDRSTSMRLAAYGVAVQRVAEATVTRGLYP
jgi:glutamate dehydrogenase (NAD(P)+)